MPARPPVLSVLLVRILGLLAIATSPPHAPSRATAADGVPAAEDEVELVLDTEPWGLALQAFTLTPEPLHVLPTDDGRIHAVYEAGTEVRITAHDVESQGQGYHFDHWEEGDTGSTWSSTDNPLVVVLDDDKAYVGHFVEEMELTLDTDPFGMPLSIFTLDPEPIRYLMLRDGRLHAIYARDTQVSFGTAEQYGNLWFEYWVEPGSPLPVVYTDNPHTVILSTPRHFQAHYVPGAPSPPGELSIDTRTMVNGRLNGTGTAPRSLGILSFDPDGNPAETVYAIRLVSSRVSAWLCFVSSGPPDDREDAFPRSDEPEWHTADEWAGKRIRGLAEGTLNAFFAKAMGEDKQESPLVWIGDYETNPACDVNLSRSATALDYALVKAALLLGVAIGDGWVYDVNDDGALDGGDLVEVRAAALNPSP